MIELLLVPDQTNYVTTDGKAVVMNQLDGGTGRYRADVLKPSFNVVAYWTLNGLEFDYFRAVYRTMTARGSEPFQCGLIIDQKEITQHSCFFIPGTMQLYAQEGSSYVVTAQLEVQPLDYDLVTDETLIALVAFDGIESLSESLTIVDEVVTDVHHSMPPGAIGIWYMDQYQATPTPIVPNSMTTTPVSQNLIRAPRRWFSNLYWFSSGATLVDQADLGPDGSLGGASSLIAAGNFQMYTSPHVTFAAGPVTIAVWAKRNTGSDQSFIIGFNGANLFSSTLVATSTWQRFVFTATLGAGTDLPEIKSFDGSTGANLLISDFAAYPGTVDLGEPALAGHMYLGLAIGNQMPVYSGGTVDFSAGKLGLIQLPAPVTLATTTAIGFARKIGSGNNFHAFLSKPGSSYVDYSAMVAENDWPDFLFGGQNVDNNAFAGLSGWHMYTNIYDGSNIQTWIDDVKINNVPRSATSPTIVDLQVGILNNSFEGDYEYTAIALYDRALSDDEVRQAYIALTADMAINSNVPSLLSKFVVGDGDSITAAVFFNAYVKVYGSAAKATVVTVDYATSGAVIATLNARATLIDNLVSAKTGRKNILTVLIGHNDLNDLTNGPQFLIDYADYCDARRSAGWLVVVCTLLTSTPVGFDAARGTVNTALRTWVGPIGTAGKHCDYIVDFDTTLMGTDGNGSNATYFVDGTHPTQAGQDILEAAYATVVNAI